MNMNTREFLKDKKRIVIKIGSSSLQHKESGDLDYAKMEVLVRELCNLRNQGKDVILVTSGAIAVGRKAIGVNKLEKEEGHLGVKQACAAVGQAKLMMIYQKIFAEYNQTTAQILMTKDTIVNNFNRQNAKNTFSELLNLGVIPVVNENDDAVLDEEGNPTYKDVTTYEYNTNCTFKLTKDIYLNDISKANWLADENNSSVRAWYTSETSTHFGGTIDGNFHTIYGVYSRYNWTDIWHGHTGGTSRGLIPAIGSGRTAVIKNLTVDCSNIFAENNAGAIVGTNRGATLTIDSCTAGKTFTLKATVSAQFWAPKLQAAVRPLLTTALPMLLP